MSSGWNGSSSIYIPCTPTLMEILIVFFCRGVVSNSQIKFLPDDEKQSCLPDRRIIGLTRFQGNPSSSHWDILHKNKNLCGGTKYWYRNISWFFLFRLHGYTGAKHFFFITCDTRVTTTQLTSLARSTYRELYCELLFDLYHRSWGCWRWQSVWTKAIESSS